MPITQKFFFAVAATLITFFAVMLVAYLFRNLSSKKVTPTKKQSKSIRDKIINNISLGTPILTIVLGILFVGLTRFHLFNPDEKDTLTIVIALLSLIGTSLSIDRLKTTKQLEDYISKAEIDFKKIRQSSPLLSALLQIDNDKDRQEIINVSKSLSDYTKLITKLSPEARKLLQEQLDAHILEYYSLTQGVIDLPLREAPFANKFLVEAYTDRLDAVSDRDIEFWLTSAGDEYFDVTTKRWGNKTTNTSKVTRIFILEREDLTSKLDDTVKVLFLHLVNNVGFAVSISPGLERFRNSVGEKNKFKDSKRNLPVKFDFALFNKDKDQVVTYFRKENPRKFFAYFATLDDNHKNNILIANQRELWVELISESWIASTAFESSINDILSITQKEELLKRAQNDNKDLLEKTGFPVEHNIFPYIIQYDYKANNSKSLDDEVHVSIKEDIKQKLINAYQLYMLKNDNYIKKV